MRTVVSPTGAAGILTPTGLATDKTTAPFFSDTLSTKRLYAFYDFENEDKIFRDVDHRVRFAIDRYDRCPASKLKRTRFAFLTRHIADLASRRFALAPDEVLKMNPNTGTLPMFRSRIDADITLGIYNRHPVLIRDDDPDGNPWGLSFSQRLFDMANDSGLFHQPKDLADAHFNGWSYKHGQQGIRAALRGEDAQPLRPPLLHLPRRHTSPTERRLAATPFRRRNTTTLTWSRSPATGSSGPKSLPSLTDRWDRDWLLGWRDIARASDSAHLCPMRLARLRSRQYVSACLSRRPRMLALPLRSLVDACLSTTLLARS